MSQAILLVSHGTVDDLDDLGGFATNVRRGRPPPADLVAELRRRYERIGGASPLNAITAEVAQKLERRVGVRVAWANRLWRPFVRDVLRTLAETGVRRVALVPLAQHSAAVYEADARAPARAAGIELVSAVNWGQNASLCEAFGSRIARVLSASPAFDRTTVVLTAHSLPKYIVDGGDAYEREVRTAADAIATVVQSRVGRAAHFITAFQSQGLSGPGPEGRPITWLGPDLPTTLDDAARRGDSHVILAPVGFLADHVEILYDLDVEARAMATQRGLTFARVESLNASDDFVEVLEEVLRPLIDHA
jgi:ferrochelatase